MSPPKALAVDFDRTLTDESLRLVPRALDALARARKHGARIVVVSGRDAAFLAREVGSHADAIVAENGCFLIHGARPARRLGPTIDIPAALASLAIPWERGLAHASAALEHEQELRDALTRAGIDADLVRNRDRVMALPRGVDKALGTLAALETLGISPQRAAAAGDGENDVAMLRAVGYGIAVANAVPELKAIARHVCARAGGDGLADWIEREWLPRLEAIA